MIIKYYYKYILFLFVFFFISSACIGSPARPYSIKKSERIQNSDAPSNISLNGLNEFPEVRNKLEQTLNKGGLAVVNIPQSNILLNFNIDKDVLFAYDDKDIMPYKFGIGVNKIITGREIMVKLSNGRYKNITWAYQRLPVTPFFISHPISIELVVNSKVIYSADGEYIISNSGQIEADSFYFLYSDRITDNYLPCAILTALGHYDLLKSGTDLQKRYMLFWIGKYGCGDAQSIIQEIIALYPELKNYCEETINIIK